MTSYADVGKQNFFYSDVTGCHWCHLPVQETRETRVRSLGWEDALEKEVATHSRILVWEIPWTAEPGGLQFIGL